jgi:LCP family protein required for cell wall assembly
MSELGTVKLPRLLTMAVIAGLSDLRQVLGVGRREARSAEQTTLEAHPMTTPIWSDAAPSSPELNEPGWEPRRGPSRRWLPIVLVAVAVVLVGALGAGFLYASSVDRSVNQNLQREPVLPDETPTGKGAKPRPTKPPTTSATGAAMNYVLIGSDLANGGVSRSDALMVLHLAADRRSAYLISFPRDLWVEIPLRGRNKINAAYAFGGASLTVRTLEGLLDVRMDHVVQVDLDGFVDLTTELGGVRVYNKHPSVSGGYNFPVGWITVSGEQAEAYVRERKQLPRGDLDRAERHRAVVQAILSKGLSGDTIKNPRRFLTFTSGVAKHVTVDEEMTPQVLRKTALSLRLSPSDIASVQAPVARFGRSPDGQSIDIVDEAQMRKMAEALREDTMADYVRAYPE